MRVLMTGGGTGGHINPALAIAKTIQKHEPDSQIAFVGTSFGMENRLVPKEGYKLYHIDIKGFNRNFSLSNIKTLFLMVTSLRKAKKLIREFKPDIAIGTGGYVSWPLIRAAADLGIPTALHESNALAGIAVKMLAPKTDIVFTNFKETENQLKKYKKIIHVGNPLKNSFSEISYDEARKNLGFNGKYRFSVLSCGGSLGAERINSTILSVMANYSSKHPEIHHLHQTGTANYSKIKAEFDKMGLNKFPNLELVDYIYDMPNRLAAADIVINRAGAMTISELSYLAKAAVLIPSPNVTDNHQFKNAKVLADANAAVLIEESSLTDTLLSDTLDKLLNDRVKRKALSENINTFAIKNADDLIYNAIKKLVISKKI